MLRGPAAHIPTTRRLYRQRWGRDWPHPDTYLRELTREAATRDEALDLMRECHAFTPNTSPKPEH